MVTAIRVDGEPAFVLHARPYRETSQLVDMFTRHHGRLRVVARGFRRLKTGSRVLEPFVPLIASWSGSGDLKTLVAAEPSGRPLTLRGDYLYSGFYLNELILRLLADHDPHDALFDHYLETIASMSEEGQIEPALRRFERILLDEVGYGLALDHTAEEGVELSPEEWYWFDPVSGISERFSPVPEKSQPNWFLGRELLAIEAGAYDDPQVARAAKRLMRLAIQHLLGDKPLSSRALFVRRTPSQQEQP